MSFWVSPAGKLVILVIGYIIFRGVKRLLGHRWPTGLSVWDLMSPLFLFCAVALIPHGAGIVLPWLVIGWMAIGILVTIIQAVQDHEIIYPTFFKTFWRLTDLYWVLGFTVCFLLAIS